MIRWSPCTNQVALYQFSLKGRKLSWRKGQPPLNSRFPCCVRLALSWYTNESPSPDKLSKAINNQPPRPRPPRRRRPLEVSNSLKPSHSWINGPWPLKTIEANGWRAPKPSKNHWNEWSGGWKSFNGDGRVTQKTSENHWKQWSVGWKTLNGNG